MSTSSMRPRAARPGAARTVVTALAGSIAVAAALAGFAAPAAAAPSAATATTRTLVPASDDRAEVRQKRPQEPFMICYYAGDGTLMWCEIYA